MSNNVKPWVQSYTFTYTEEFGLGANQKIFNTSSCTVYSISLGLCTMSPYIFKAIVTLFLVSHHPPAWLFLWPLQNSLHTGNVPHKPLEVGKVRQDQWLLNNIHT